MATLDNLIERGKEENGRLLVPYKHTTEDGWCEFRPVDPLAPVHLWAVSHKEEDRQRLEAFRRGAEDEWAAVTQRPVRSPDDRAWTRYLAGEVPDYPERILQANYREVCDRLDKVLNDEQDLTKLDVHWWQQVNPVVSEALMHLTTGGPQTIYWGGLAQGRVRYYDSDGRRPGLPSDVAALVTGLEADGMRLSLVNLHPAEARRLTVGAGPFGEHRFTRVRTGDATTAVDGGHFDVRLEPAAQLDLEVAASQVELGGSFVGRSGVVDFMRSPIYLQA